MRRPLHYAWVILALCFFGLLAAQGVRLSFGAFIAPWERSFGMSRAAVSFVSLISFVVYGLSQPLVGRLVDRFGVRRVLAFSVLLVGASLAAAAFARRPWQLALAYGVLASVGFGGASGVGASVAVTKWFSARRGLAFGIIEAGFAAGQLALVPTSLFLIERWGWQRTLLAFGAGSIGVVFPILLLFLRSTPAERGERPYGAESQQPAGADQPAAPAAPARLGAVFRSRAFWGLALPYFICGITTTGMIDTHLIPYAHGHGHSTALTGAVVSLLAACNIIGTFASGPLADRFDNRLILGAIYAVRAGSLVMLLSLREPQWLLVFGAIFGLVDFAVVAPTHMLASHYFDGQSLGTLFGLLSLSHQLGSALGAYLPGLIYDLAGGYQIPFGAGAAALVLAAALSFRLPRVRRAVPPPASESPSAAAA